MQIQPQLVLLQKTLLYIEGLGRQLYPQLDLWETAQPFMNEWAEQRFGPSAVINQWVEAGPELWQQLANLPESLGRNEQLLRTLQFNMAHQSENLAELQTSIQQKKRRSVVYKSVGGGLLTASILLFWQPITTSLAQTDGLTALTGIAAAVIGSVMLLRS